MTVYRAPTLSCSHTYDIFLLSLIMQIIFVSAFYFKPVIGLLSNRFFNFFGVVSYPLYLIHQNVGVALMEFSEAMFPYPLLG